MVHGPVHSPSTSYSPQSTAHTTPDCPASLSPGAALHDVHHPRAVPVLDGLQLLGRDADDLDELDGPEGGADLTQIRVSRQQDVLQARLAAVQRHVVRHVVTAHQQVT